MTSEQEADLLAWYAKSARDLPWRRTRELYPVLVSELMLQQTTVAAVIPLYHRFMRRFPDLGSLAQASPDAVMEAWSGLGYYSRAKRLHQSAQLLEQAEQMPTSLGELLELPGLGPYTAAAVASIALGLPHLALDTNALRVLLRLYGWETRADKGSVADALRRKVEQGLPGSDFGQTNQAIMELGATLCRVKTPECKACPLARHCQAKALAAQDRIPVPKPRKKPRTTPAKAYLVGSGQAFVLVRGTSLGLLSDLFGPPIDFGAENSSASPLTPLLEWLRSQQGNPAERSLGYAISGRRLEIEILRFERPGFDLTLLEQAQSCGVQVGLWPTNSGLALSSLARKILKVG